MYIAFAEVLYAAVAAFAIFVSVYYDRSDESNNDSAEYDDFDELLTNPAYRAAAVRLLARREELEGGEDISDSEIRDRVEQLFDPQENNFNYARLKLIAHAAAPFLIEALHDPRAAVLFAGTRHPLSAASPFERICQLLSQTVPRDAVEPLTQYLAHENAHFRKHAAILLGSIGTTECIEPVITALNDDDDYVRSYAMMGIQRGIEAERCEHDFLMGVFPALVKLLDRSDGSVSGTAPSLLLAIDAEKTVPSLLSPQYFTIGNSQLQYIICALNREDIPIPLDKLLPLLEQLEPIADQYPHSYEYAQAFLAYARTPDAQAESTFRRHLQSSDEQVQAAAANALATLNGVGDHRAVVSKLLNEHGFEALSLALKHYYAVLVYDSQVNNGGHSQFFRNSSGRYFKFARDGLLAIGARKRAAILRDAIGRLGPDELPDEDDPRQNRLAQLFQQRTDAFDALDERYYSCTENVEQLLGLYAIEHKADFVEPEL
jgi:HEAT repeat protein